MSSNRSDSPDHQFGGKRANSLAKSSTSGSSNFGAWPPSKKYLNPPFEADGKGIHASAQFSKLSTKFKMAFDSSSSEILAGSMDASRSSRSDLVRSNSASFASSSSSLSLPLMRAR